MQLEFQHDVSELSVLRHSVRTFLSRRLEETELEACMAPLSGATALFGAQTRYVPVHVDQTPSKLGTYGVIHDAKTFLVAVTSLDDLRAGYLQIGYQLEQTVLLAADKGLGSCWLGGTFDKSAFWQAAGVTEKERLAVILPIGYPAGKKSILEHIMRRTAGSNNRHPFEKLFFHEDGTPVSEQAAGAFSVPLSCVQLAPSAMNRQPWRLYLSQNRVCFYANKGKQSKKSTQIDTSYVDMGIALCHFELGAQQAGLDGNWGFNDPALPASESFEFIAAWEMQKK